ncbi:MAG TPA: hypothetical protein VHQ48_04510, partial [Bradyrhizobium sp.]|nr:hypothetical protein [Bradyrhizobium sp.]
MSLLGRYCCKSRKSNSPKNLNVESLQRAFDLTCREAQTAIAIAHGQGLKTAARSMGVAPTTVRSQL